jgi:hypothetical protein
MPSWHLNDYTNAQLKDIWEHQRHLLWDFPRVGYVLNHCTDIPLRVRISTEVRAAMFTVEDEIASPLLPNPFLAEDELRAYESWIGAKS